MMSYFAPFDLGLFYLSSLLLRAVLYFFAALVYRVTFLASLIDKRFDFLGAFFCSLGKTSKGFSFYVCVAFFFIYFTNFYSVYSFSFPVNSQVRVVILFRFLMWGNLNILSVLFNFRRWISHFVPEGSPLGLAILLFLIERISAAIRPITLTVRLVANILAGHLLLTLLSLFILKLPAFFPARFILCAVEIFVSLIQAYIFATLVYLYACEV